MGMNDSLPDGIPAFLTAAGWGTAQVEPLPGDASFRRYFRIRDGEKSAMLMHAPPPHEDPQPFLRAAKWLDGNGLRAPHILAEDAAAGLVLLEDFGEVRMREYLDEWPADESEVYRGAIDALVKLHRLPPAERISRDSMGCAMQGPGWRACWRSSSGMARPELTPAVTGMGAGHSA